MTREVFTKHEVSVIATYLDVSPSAVSAVAMLAAQKMKRRRVLRAARGGEEP